MKRVNHKFVILLIFVLAGLCACAPRSVPLNFSSVPAMFLDQRIYPEKFEVIHRCTLSIAGRTMVFNGYLKVDSPLNTIRCVAQTDMGATLFKYSYQDGKLVVSYCSPGFKPDWVKNFALRDATLIYLPCSSATLPLGNTQERIVTDARLTRYRIRKGDVEVYTAMFSYSDPQQGVHLFEGAIPTTITIIDKTLHYRLDIRVVDLRCIPKNES